VILSKKDIIFQKELTLLGSRYDKYNDRKMREYTTMAIRIVLTPTVSHCIETVAKREYWKNVNNYLKKRKEDERLEGKIELLRSFLETADFANLRRKSEEHILHGKQVKFIVSIKNKKLLYEMIVEKSKQKINKKKIL